MVSWNTPAGLKRSLRALLPWLSCLNGAKTIETESWSTKWPALSTSLASSERHRSLDALSQAWSSIVGLGTGPRTRARCYVSWGEHRQLPCAQSEPPYSSPSRGTPTGTPRIVRPAIRLTPRWRRMDSKFQFRDASPRHCQLSEPRAPFSGPARLERGSTIGEQRSSPTRAAAPPTRAAYHGRLS